MIDVSQARYTEVVLANQDREFELRLTPVEVGMFHGAIRLMLLHPQVQEMSSEFHVMAEKLREFCLSCFSDMGFTDEEIEYLDSAFD